MNIILWVFALACSPFYQESEPPVTCEQRADAVCCTWLHPVSEDDSALWSSEVNCIDTDTLIGTRCDYSSWRYAGSGFDYIEGDNND